MKVKDWHDMKVVMDGSSGIEELVEYVEEEYPGFDEAEDYNSGVSRLINSVLLPELAPDTTIEPYREVEREYHDNYQFYEVPVALSEASQKALKANLRAQPRYKSNVLGESPLSAHLKRVIQHFAVSLTDFEREGPEENVDGSTSILGK